MISKLFTKSMAHLEQVLNVRSLRHQVITANIVNQDTPGYKAKELDFKQALKATATGSDPIRLIKTDKKHLTPQSSAASPISEQIKLSRSGRSNRLDGNTVKAEKEMTRLAENTLMYQATAQLIAGKFRGLKNAIREGR